MAEQPEFLKSSYSGQQNDACVEAATNLVAGPVLVRDSKDIAVPAVAVSRDAWTAFLADL
ncbi:DUF397 domain-containing protein [Streptomyces daliensis]|uniref:DUF397 domain-containing protein n=1 Tax=Streptomyces daliensis TaxID=299421 RepID=A0A8T4ILZ4_9ACTN|nr:DUF397 domain-containing protein [Streptomyces daliensis]